MELSVGERLGPYEIVELIGNGGMGEVYRARDSRLGRDVAIKVSSQRFSERFEREARVVASLNHPNICHLYDIGPNYLVMELVEGNAPKGPLPLETALNYARQIASGLEAAHEKGVVHRDLKPANIKITPEGVVKVLDFGLAKQGPEEDASSAGEDSPTLSMAGTQAGVILGTAGYMSPEQARGKRVDKRADIWAFGVVLYEMLMGQRLFQGEDASHTMAAVIMQEPKLDTVPIQVRGLLRRCLEKDPKKRLRDIADAMPMVDDSLGPIPAAHKEVKARTWLWPAIAGALVVALATVSATHFREKPVERPLVRLDVDLGSDVSLVPMNDGDSSVILSPDGTRLAYLAGNPQSLFIRRLDQPKATEVPGSRGAVAPFFSPDGQWLGFYARGRLNKISVEGGSAVPLTDSSFSAHGASWGEDGGIVLLLGLGKGLGRIPATGGAPTPLTDLANGEVVHAYPNVLPGGKAVLFVPIASPSNPDTVTIDVVTIADHRRKTLVRGGTSPHYLSSGHLLYTNRSTLFAIPFDAEKLETHGAPVRIADDVAFYLAGNGTHFDVSRDGTLIYRKSGTDAAAGPMTVQWVDAAGKRELLLAKPAAYSAPHLSPDGKRLAVTIADESGRSIWIYDQARDSMARLTSTGFNDAPQWTPDGRYIVFLSVGNGILWTRSDGAGQPQPLLPSKSALIPWSFTPDGKRLAYFENRGQIWTLPVEEKDGQLKAGQPEQFLQSQFSDQLPAFSPDGHWLAYQSNESGRPEVYVRPFPPPASGQGGKWQISNSGGGMPSWSPNGRDLLYVNRVADQMMAVTYTVRGDVFQPEKPRVWIAKLGNAILGNTSMSLSPDGKRVALLTPVDTPETPKPEHEIVFLQNFSDELRRRVPVDK